MVGTVCMCNAVLSGEPGAQTKFVGLARQADSEVWPVSGEYFPAAHKLHSAEPLTPLYVPGAHAAQGPPCGPVKPRRHWQFAIALLPAAESECAGHAWHVDSAVAPDAPEYLPAPHLVQIVPPNEVVVVIGHEIKLGNRVGTMSLCMPYNAIESVMEDLNAENWFSSGKPGQAEVAEEAIVERISDSMLQIEATLAETTITLRDLSKLDVGDLLTTDRLANRPVMVSVEGQPKFEASLGQHRGQRAIRIENAIGDSLEEESEAPLASN